MTDITIVNGVYKPTYNWGAPSCRASCLIITDSPPFLSLEPGEVPRIHYGKRCSTNFFFTKFSKKPAASSQWLDQTLPWDHSPEACAEGESHWITYADSSIWRDENFCIQEWIQKGIPGYPKVPLLLLRYPWSFHRITWDMASIAPIQFSPWYTRKMSQCLLVKPPCSHPIYRIGNTSN
jgi:hypothetical protein